ncbi:MAG: Replicative helicase [Candidatus Eisenbacteria bacterium]
MTLDVDLPSETLACADSADALERLVLGASFDDPTSLHKAIETGLRAEDFSSEDRAMMWRALVRLDADELPFDAIGLETALSLVAPAWGTPRRHELIASVVDWVVSGAWVDVHALGVIRWARWRRAERFARKAIATAPTTSSAVDSWCERFTEGALKTCEEPTEAAKPVSIASCVADLVERRLNPSADEEGERLSLPWRALTVATGGLRPGQLVVLAARPKVGKSAAVLAIALHVALTGPVLFCSLEMTRAEVSERTVSILARVDASVAQGIRPPDAAARTELMEASSIASRLPLEVIDASTQTLTSIRAAARRMRARGGLKLIVVDYMQLMASELSGRDTTREREVAVIARGLKTLAKDMECPVIALSQLNRGAGETEEPTLRNLRESGAIEQDANAVWFLHREKAPDAAALTEEIKLIVAAQRSGACGARMDLTYRKAWLTFFENASDAPPSYCDAADPADAEPWGDA